MDLLKISFLLLFLVSCSNARYKDDYGFLNSSQANSPEYPVYINNKLCLDLDKRPGLCAIRVKSNQSIELKIDPQMYDYRLQLQCTKALDLDKSFDVEKQKDFSFVILPTSFSTLRSFTCIGEVFPKDRQETISAKFEIRFIVYDAEYIGREYAYFLKTSDSSVVNVGDFARSITVYYYEKGKLRLVQAWKSNPVEIPSTQFYLYSESANMRFNYIEVL